MYRCIDVYMHTCIHVYIHTCMHACIYIYICVNTISQPFPMRPPWHHDAKGKPNKSHTWFLVKSAWCNKQVGKSVIYNYKYIIYIYYYIIFGNQPFGVRSFIYWSPHLEYPKNYGYISSIPLWIQPYLEVVGL